MQYVLLSSFFLTFAVSLRKPGTDGTPCITSLHLQWYGVIQQLGATRHKNVEDVGTLVSVERLALPLVP
jgi:hypothetical protein